jgi:hypothetical protein
MPKMSAYWSSVFANRKRGIYDTTDTLNELEFAVRDMEPSDKIITLVRRLHAFNVYTLKEFLPQVRAWKHQGCRLQDCNVREKEVGGKKVYLFVIQLPVDKMEADICPLCVSLDFMVSGCGYITTDPDIITLIKRALA